MSASDEWGLVGKTAIVTGGGAAGDGIGNGRATAILLARTGARVLVVDSELPLAARTVEMIEAEGGTASAYACDVTDSEACRAMVATAIARYGRLDVLDNNVGIGSRGTVLEESEENWRRVMRVNVDTMFLVSKHAIPEMIRSGGGAIVNVASIAALVGGGLTAYSTSKGAVISLTRSMAVDHGKDGIRVNCVAPGPVYTPMVYAGGMSDAMREMRRRASVQEIEGTGWDVGYAVRFLLSAQARYITGHVLVVDGGVTLSPPARGSHYRPAIAADAAVPISPERR
jgi:NAD(P)-dependent dehydrogenase (short-subunit alcohol dehydrogenase family)